MISARKAGGPLAAALRARGNGKQSTPDTRQRSSVAMNRGPGRHSQPMFGERACPCGGGCPRCAASGRRDVPAPLRARAESLMGADFSGVALHPDAARVTAPLGARAVTRGQEIYFHPGEFEPGTATGDALVMHELAHTLQTRQANDVSAGFMGPVSRPGDSLEQNASALARGATTHAMAAPAGAALRTPFDAETADDRTRREHLLTSIDNAVDRILRLLQTGGLIEGGEVATERAGVRGVIYGEPGTDENFASYAERDARLHRIVRSLLAMSRLYRSAPVPADFSAPTDISVETTRDGEAPTTRTEFESAVTVPGGTAHFIGPNREWADLQGAYQRYQVAEGRTGGDFNFDWLYLDPTARIVTGAARGAPRIGRGVPSGAYMVVPDIEHDPLRYWRLDGFTPTPRGSIIVEFWHDDFGYYYMRHDERIDVPSPWSH